MTSSGPPKRYFAPCPTEPLGGPGHSYNHLHIKPILYLKSEVRDDGKVLHMHCTIRLLRYVVVTATKARDETKNS